MAFKLNHGWLWYSAWYTFFGEHVGTTSGLYSWLSLNIRGSKDHYLGLWSE
jgi:hypothetical protein